MFVIIDFIIEIGIYIPIFKQQEYINISSMSSMSISNPHNSADCTQAYGTSSHLGLIFIFERNIPSLSI